MAWADVVAGVGAKKFDENPHPLRLALTFQASSEAQAISILEAELAKRPPQTTIGIAKPMGADGVFAVGFNCIGE